MDIENEAWLWADVYIDDGLSAEEARARMTVRFDELGPDGCAKLPKRKRAKILAYCVANAAA